MKYELVNGQPKQIKKITLDGMIYTNPSDSLLEANNIGYTRTVVQAPELDDNTKKLTHTYEVVNGSITDVWTVVDKTKDELIEMYQSQIDAIYQQAENYKNNGRILYPVTGKEYLPRWVFEFYNTALINKDSYFPTNESMVDISAVDGSTDSMSFADFVQLYGYLITVYMTATGQQNYEIAELNSLIEALNAPEEEPEESEEEEIEDPEGETVEEEPAEEEGEPE